MSATSSPAEVPISVSHALAALYDHVDLRPAKLEAVLPVLDLDFNDLSSTHIHLGHKALMSLTERTTLGQCLKVFPDSSEERRREVRAQYVDYLIPGFPKEKIPTTTLVAIDLPGITIETFLRAHGLTENARPIPTRDLEPDMFDLEQAICHQASKVLLHELLHIPKPAKTGVTKEEHDTHRENEEAFIESRLAEIGEEGVPTRLVNVRLARRFTMESLATALQTIQDYRE